MLVLVTIASISWKITSRGVCSSSFSCELGGPTTSLLGTGVVVFPRVFLNVGFLTGRIGFDTSLPDFTSEFGFQTPVAEFGVPLGAFEKKLRIDPFLEELEACFLSAAGGAGDDMFSFFAMTILI